MQMKEFLILVIYDITENKRRAAFAKKLKSYGFRVQRSSFEITMTTANLRLLLGEIPHLIKDTQDNVRVYELGNRGNVYQFGQTILPSYEEVLIV